MKPLFQRLQKPLLTTVSAVLILVALVWSFYQWRDQRMSSNWASPFLSGAEYLTPGESTFFINMEDINRFKALDDAAKEDAFVFRHTSSPQPHTYGFAGYSYLIKGARLIFPFAGHQLAIILLQCLIHLVLCLCVISEKSLPLRMRILFLVLYALNPVVLRFVTFNFYYFWQVIPSFWLLFLGLKIRNKLAWAVVLLALPLVLLTRPTTVFVVMACLIGFTWFRSRTWGVFYTLVFASLVGWLYVPTQKNLWHTIYAGIGGFSNPYGISLSDEDVYALYQKHTGKPLNASIGGNFHNPVVMEEFTAINRAEYLAILKDSPALLIKNAVVYFFGSFGLGYINKAPQWLNYLLAAGGLLFFMALLYHQKYLILVFLILGVVGFVLYYPPIQAYMYGNYLLLVWGFIEVITPYFPKSKHLPHEQSHPLPFLQ
jgi:hypothetical protein